MLLFKNVHDIQGVKPEINDLSVDEPDDQSVFGCIKEMKCHEILLILKQLGQNNSNTNQVV